LCSHLGIPARFIKRLTLLMSFVFSFMGRKSLPPSDSLTAAEGYKSLDFEQSLPNNNIYK